jgi:hypothetical protein
VVAVAVDHDMQVVVVQAAWLFQPLLNLQLAIFHYLSVDRVLVAPEQRRVATAVNHCLDQ